MCWSKYERLLEEQAEERGSCGAFEVHAGVRRAIDTVKMPHGSICCSIFSNPATRTNSSISACEQRRLSSFLREEIGHGHAKRPLRFHFGRQRGRS